MNQHHAKGGRQNNLLDFLGDMSGGLVVPPPPAKNVKIFSMPLKSIFY